METKNYQINNSFFSDIVKRTGREKKEGGFIFMS